MITSASERKPIFPKQPFKTESMPMAIAGMLGFKRLRWSLRRAHCPVSSDALVLEVGAGGNPYPRSNVLLDAQEATIERWEQELITDRPIVLGLCEELPFKDKAFDFVIASHVLEHSDNPERFLSELMRVGKAGYIETPDGWFEKLCALTYHRLEVSLDGDKLIIRKKKSWKPDEIAHLWDIKLANSKEMSKFLRQNPELHHLRFYWSNEFYFEVLNPEIDAGWPFPPEASVKTFRGLRERSILKLRDIYLSARRWLWSQRKRNKALDVFGLLRCPVCHSSDLKNTPTSIVCISCAATYPIQNGVPNLFPGGIEGFNKDRVKAKSS